MDHGEPELSAQTRRVPVTSGSGRCMCGAVTYMIDGPMRDVFVCHCHRCRRWTGHYLAGTNTQHANIRVDGEVTWYRPGAGAQYGFCARCGSSLFWQADGRSDITIAAGTLDQPTGLQVTTAWWMDEHADYHPPLPGLVEHPLDG